MLKSWDNHQKRAFRLLRNQPMAWSHQTGQGERGFYILEVTTLNKPLETLSDQTTYANPFMYYMD